MKALDPALAVYALLEEITLRPRFALRDNLSLKQDLRVGPDSYALQVIPVLERRLGIHPSQDEWGAVATVADLVTLAEAHVLRGQLSITPA